MSDTPSRTAAGQPLEPGTRVVAVRDQASATMPDETIILGMREGAYYGVSQVGTRIWELAATPTTLGAIHAAITAEYDVSPASAWTDLVSFITALDAAGLVELGPLGR